MKHFVSPLILIRCRRRRRPSIGMNVQPFCVIEVMAGWHELCTARSIFSRIYFYLSSVDFQKLDTCFSFLVFLLLLF